MGEGEAVLKYILTDINDIETSFKNPISMSIVSSEDAPADSFKAIFAVSGKIPEIYSVKVLKGGEVIFFGFVDEQIETFADNGILIEIRARGPASVLLDNEAMPQTYCMPTMKILYERHFRPLGFKGVKGGEKAFPGDLVISKGMSEWQVLSNYCEKFCKSKPVIRDDLVIETGENYQPDMIYIGENSPIIKMSRTINRGAPISDIYARTYIAGGYDMYFQNEMAKNHKINRRRYFNCADSKYKSILYADNIIKSTNRKYESYFIDISGILGCKVRDRLQIKNKRGEMRINELHYILDSSGEHTRIYAEVIV